MRPIGKVDIEVKPCPFCGSRAVVETYITEAAVFCTGCRACIKRPHPPKNDAGVELAVQAWDRRIA